MKINQDQNFEIETKKDFIIRLAKKDPFLKIEEIAQLVETTPRYVRTILSEANLSLMNLREEYARKLGKTTDSRIVLSLKETLNALRLHNKVAGPAFSYAPSQHLMDEGEKFYWNPEQAPLYKYFQYIYFHNKIFGIIVFIMRTMLTEEDLAKETAIFKVAGLTPEETKLTNPEIQIAPLNNLLLPEIIAGTDFKEEQTMVEIKTLVNVKDKVFGEETFYFPADYVKLTIPGFFSPVLELAPDC